MFSGRFLRKSSLFILVAWVVFASHSTANALVLDWNSVTWTAGSLSQSFDIDPNNPGNDITITISGDTGQLTSNSPAIDAAQRGGLPKGQDSLSVHTDFANNTQTITVTITFNYAEGVDGVNFSLFDIDKKDNARIDVVSAIWGSYFGSNIVGAAVTGSTDNSVSGSGTNTTVTGTGSAADNSSLGNVGIDYGTNVVNQVTFTFSTTSSGNPGDQRFWLSDITFSPKAKYPEVHPAWAAIGICGLVVLIRSGRRLFTFR